MSDIVNLRQARKRAEREQARQEADQRAAQHGLSKAQKILAASQSAAARKMLDSKKLSEE
ncbi:DUF4169 family protein [Brevirhabdus sp.]|uniref:DUF4169 family protein n=1 Tax=Brevirhabdus sp. TaxID=2004514 RepID=UPI004059597E